MEYSHRLHRTTFYRLVATPNSYKSFVFVVPVAVVVYLIAQLGLPQSLQFFWHVLPVNFYFVSVPIKFQYSFAKKISMDKKLIQENIFS